jgi:ribosomal protein S18 acetylase RimI-like enzyme
MTQLIVPIAIEHIPGFWRAVDLVAREGRYLALLQSPPIAATEAFVAGNLAKGNPHFVVLEAGEVVGWCDIVRHERETRAHCGTLGMGLLPAQRGRGIGRRLIETAVAAAWERGFKRIELTVNEGNERALRLYRSVGFVIEGRGRRAARFGQSYLDVFAMARLAPDMLGEM